MVKNRLMNASLQDDMNAHGEILEAVEVQREHHEDWKRGKTISPALAAPVLRLTAESIHQQWLAEQSQLEKAACQWEVTYMMPPPELINSSSVRAAPGVLFWYENAERTEAQ